MARTRVVHIVESFLSGTLEVIRNICNHLDPDRFETWVLHSVRENTPRDYPSLFRTNIRLVQIPMAREIQPVADAVAWVSILDHLLRIRPDVVHTHSSKAGILGRAAAGLVGVRRIFHTPHGYPFLMGDSRGGLYRGCERLASLTGAATIAVSKAEGDYARSVSRRVFVIRNAISVNGVAVRETNRVMTCGRLTPHLSPELVSRLSRDIPGTKFVWVGDGPSRSLLDGVEVTGWLPRDQALQTVASASVYLHPSRWEGMPLSVLEAMALRKPVVVSDIPAHREIIDPGVNGFIARTEADYCLILRRLLSDRALRRRIGEQARLRLGDQAFPRTMAEAYGRLYAGADR